MSKEFPNGFQSWMETHHEVVSAITIGALSDLDCMSPVLSSTTLQQGTHGLYELAEAWTDEFENKYKGRDWSLEGDYWDVIEEFTKQKLKDE